MIGQRLAVWGTAALPATRTANERRRADESRQRAEGAAIPRASLAPARHVLAFLSRSVLLQLMLAMALISFAALVYLNQASKQSVLEFSNVDLQSQQIELNLRNANLYATAARLTSLNRVKNLASSQLHMSPPSPASVT